MTKTTKLPYIDFQGFDPKSSELYGVSIVNRPIEIKYGRKWWQFWKPWKMETLTTIQMQKRINERIKTCLENL